MHRTGAGQIDTAPTLPSPASGGGNSPLDPQEGRELTAGDGSDDEERFGPCRHRLGQRRIRRFVGEILLAGVEPDEGATLVRDLVADRAAQHRIAGLDRIDYRLLGGRTGDV